MISLEWALEKFRETREARRRVRCDAAWFFDERPRPPAPHRCRTCGADDQTLTVMVIENLGTGARRQEWHCADVRACNLRRHPALRDLLPATPAAPRPPGRLAPPRVAAFCRDLANNGWPLDEPPRLYPDLWPDPFRPEYGFPTIGGAVMEVLAEIGRALADSQPPEHAEKLGPAGQ